MKIIGARDKVLNDVVCTLSTGPHASPPQEGKTAQRELMRTECLLSKVVLPASAATELQCGLPSGSPDRRCPTEAVTPIEWLATEG